MNHDVEDGRGAATAAAKPAAQGALGNRHCAEAEKARKTGAPETGAAMIRFMPPGTRRARRAPQPARLRKNVGLSGPA
jgi:hypothetical protein